MSKIQQSISNPRQEYQKKLVKAEEAVKLIRSQDRVQYGEFLSFPIECDAALAQCKDELYDVRILMSTLTSVPQVALCDPSHEHFVATDFSYSLISRKLADAGLLFYMPSTYHEAYKIFRQLPDSERPTVGVVTVSPMDENGYFNFGTTCSMNPLLPEMVDRLIVEVNTNMPRVHGPQNYLHISQVDRVVEGKNPKLLQIPKQSYSEIDDKIAGYIVKELEDGACLQLGIGSMPNRVGELIAQSDVKDLGVHTEMLVDSFVDIYNTGRITNLRKTIDKGQFVFTFAMGSDKLYEFIHNNPLCKAAAPDYTNDPFMIAQNDKVFSVCSCLEVDLYGQVSSESMGARQISGIGGQFDFIFASHRSKGGKGFACLNSSYMDKDGNLTSRIVPGLEPCTAVSLPRYITYYIVTEYGIVNLKGKPTWQRAEELISIAHPDLRDELVKKAEKLKIWRHSNKR